MDDQNRNMPPRRDPKNFEVHIPEEELSTGARRPPYSPKYVETRDSILIAGAALLSTYFFSPW